MPDLEPVDLICVEVSGYGRVFSARMKEPFLDIKIQIPHEEFVIYIPGGQLFSAVVVEVTQKPALSTLLPSHKIGVTFPDQLMLTPEVGSMYARSTLHWWRQ